MYERMLQYCCCEGGDCCFMNKCYNIVVVVKLATAVRGGVSIREQRSSSRSRRGGVSKNWTEGATVARLFFLTAVAITIAMRPFKYHEISVSNTTTSFVFSIHSFGFKGWLRVFYGLDLLLSKLSKAQSNGKFRERNSALN